MHKFKRTYIFYWSDQKIEGDTIVTYYCVPSFLSNVVYYVFFFFFSFYVNYFYWFFDKN